MLITQISVFIENQPGKLGEVTQVLADNGVDMSALSLADTTDFGILRLIVNDPDKATEVLRTHDFIVKQSPVIAAVVDDRPGGLTEVLQILSPWNTCTPSSAASRATPWSSCGRTGPRRPWPRWSPTTSAPWTRKIFTASNLTVSSSFLLFAPPPSQGSCPTDGGGVSFFSP